VANADVRGYLDRMAAIQSAVVAGLTDLPREDMRYQTGNWRWNTVRRVMLRFGDHVREHTTQLVAAREAIGSEQTMPQRMLAQAMLAYGYFLGAMVGLQDEDLDTAPEAGEWTPRQVLDHLLEGQQGYLDWILQAREERQVVEKD
jgi:hypothetical protein